MNVGSILGFIRPFEATSTYAGTKFALAAFSDSLRQEVEDQNISVSLLQPAYIQSAILDNYMHERTENEGNKLSPIEALYPTYFHPDRTATMELVSAMGGSPLETSRAMEDALTSPFPFTRYDAGNFLGVPAWLVRRVAHLLPDRLNDRFLRYAMLHAHRVEPFFAWWRK